MKYAVYIELKCEPSVLICVCGRDNDKDAFELLQPSRKMKNRWVNTLA